MMKSLGHTVYLYAGEDNEAPVDELITCITKEQQAEALDGKHYTEAAFDNNFRIGRSLIILQSKN
jgi:hypothetical protein